MPPTHHTTVRDLPGGTVSERRVWNLVPLLRCGAMGSGIIFLGNNGTDNAVWVRVHSIRSQPPSNQSTITHHTTPPIHPLVVTLLCFRSEVLRRLIQRNGSASRLCPRCGVLSSSGSFLRAAHPGVHVFLFFVLPPDRRSGRLVEAAPRCIPGLENRPPSAVSAQQPASPHHKTDKPVNWR